MKMIIWHIFLSVNLISFLVLAPGCNGQGHEHHHHHEMGKQDTHLVEETSAEEAGGICPVMGGKVNREYSYIHQGKTYYFCCPGCIEEFKKNPEKYISKTKEFSLEAYQFGFSPESITVKKGDIVKMLTTSRDVPHGIYIKEYGINVPVKKDEVKKIEFIADKAGKFDILCSVYCGRGHHQMKARLIIEQ